MGAINLVRTNRKFAAAKFLVRLQLRDQIFLRVRSPCSIKFQNSRLSFSCSSSPVGSLVRKRKRSEERRVGKECRSRWRPELGKKKYRKTGASGYTQCNIGCLIWLEFSVWY